jgi:hypothetical protein
LVSGRPQAADGEALSSAADCGPLLVKPPNLTLEAPYFGDRAFSDTWKRTDQLVASGEVNRSWYWGPHQISGPIYEEYDEGQGGRRLVQYFDKSRMEINYPCAEKGNPPGPSREDRFFVTNGLLTVELVSGKIQVGLKRYEDHTRAGVLLTSADIPLASDTDDMNAPTYASFKELANTLLGDHRATALTGTVMQSVNKMGQVKNDDTKFKTHNVKYSYFVSETGHNVADKIWDFLNMTGPTLEQNDQRYNVRLSDPWYYATGYPISEPYWANVKIAGKQTDVLIQLFERRVVTVTYGSNGPKDFKVEMGNIGQHYLQWRYRNVLPGQAMVYDANPTGGKICRALSDSEAADVTCQAAVVENTPSGVVYYNNRVKANADGTINVLIPTTGTKFRLLQRAELQIKAREDLKLGETLLLALGTAMFDHPDAHDELEVRAGDTRITVVRTGAADRLQAVQATQAITATKFSVEQLEGGDMKVAVVAVPISTSVIVDDGSTPPIFAGDAGQRVVLGGPGKQEQVRISKTGVISGPEALDADTVKLWNTYAGGISGSNIDTYVPPSVLGAKTCPGPYFGSPAFEKVWRRTDQPVACGQASRGWYWGPSQVSGPIYEKYKEGQGGTRLVQYFEKSRMEINNPAQPDLVTNGLLTMELVSGKMQVGIAEYENRTPANVPLASDNNDSNAPTYASFVQLANTPLGDHPAQNLTGQTVNQRVNKAGQVSRDAALDKYGVKYGFYNAETKHNIADKMWEFLNASGPTLNASGQTVNAKLSDPWFNNSGFAISEPYWANVRIAGKQTVVLVQLFERRVLIYQPDGAPGFKVQMGNVGTHYVQWRYPKGVPGQIMVYNTQGSGGTICRNTQPGLCIVAKANDPSSGVAYYDDRIRTNANGTLSGRTAANKFRLLESSEIRLKPKTDLNLGDMFVLSLGTAVFDHVNAEGEIVVEAGDVRVEPVDAPPFSVQVRQDGSVEIKVESRSGLRGVLVTTPRGQQRQVGPGEQMVVPR